MIRKPSGKRKPRGPSGKTRLDVVDKHLVRLVVNGRIDLIRLFPIVFKFILIQNVTVRFSVVDDNEILNSNNTAVRNIETFSKMVFVIFEL